MSTVEDAETDTLLGEDHPAKSVKTTSNARQHSLTQTQNMAVPIRKLVRWVKIIVALASVAAAIVLLQVFAFGHKNALGFSVPPPLYQIGDELQYIYPEKLLKFTEEAYEKALLIDVLDDHFASAPDIDSCEAILGKPAKSKRELRSVQFHPYLNTVCLQWKGKAKLIIRQSMARGSNCYSFNWTADSMVDTLHNCIHLDGAHWYGGGLLGGDQWPLEDISIPLQPFTSSPLGAFSKHAGKESYGPVLERMWLSSTGFGVFVEKDIPLHVSINSGGDMRLCLRSRYGNSQYTPRTPLSLNYSVCMDRTAKQVQGHMLQNFVTLPRMAPHEELLRDPVWSTRGINMHSLTQNQLLSLQGSIKTHKYPHRCFGCPRTRRQTAGVRLMFMSM